MQIKSVIYFTTELKEGLENLNESCRVLSNLLSFEKTNMSSNKDFLPSSSPISSICAIEIEAILFLFHDEVFVTSLHSKNVLQLLY